MIELSIKKANTGEYMVVWSDKGRPIDSKTYYTDDEMDAAETLWDTYNWTLKSDGSTISGDRLTQKVLEKYPEAKRRSQYI